MSARRKTVAELTRQGMSIRQIAEMLQCTERTVQRARRQTGVSQPAWTRLTTEQWIAASQLLSDGASYAEAARTVGCDSAYLARKIPGYAWSRIECGQHAALLRRMGRAVSA